MSEHDFLAAREDYMESLEQARKLKLWIDNYEKDTDYRLKSQIIDVLSKRLKEVEQRIVKLENILSDE